jgi:hypothetical protein
MGKASAHPHDSIDPSAGQPVRWKYGANKRALRFILSAVFHELNIVAVRVLYEKKAGMRVRAERARAYFDSL